MKSNWIIIGRDDKHELVYIVDTSNQVGGMTITNDAEAVLTFFQNQYGQDWRVVYTDTDGEQFMLSWGYYAIEYTKWDGLDWYLLKKA